MCWKKCKKKNNHVRFTRVARVFCICEFPSWRNNKACRVCHNGFCASFPTYTTWDFSTFGFGKLLFVMSCCGLQKKESKSVRCEMTWGCVNDHIIEIFGWFFHFCTTSIYKSFAEINIVSKHGFSNTLLSSIGRTNLLSHPKLTLLVEPVLLSHTGKKWNVEIEMGKN